MMPKKPAIPHEDVVAFILAGNTTKDAKEHFGFANDNVANNRVWAAFKRLGVERPRFSEKRECEFCGTGYLAARRNRSTCGSPKCQQAWIVRWQGQNPEIAKAALAKYRRTPKGRANNRRAKVKKLALFRTGNAAERWLYAAEECKKALRKRHDIARRSPWHNRIETIQSKTLRRSRDVSPRARRNVDKEPYTGEKREGTNAQLRWLNALRAVQTVVIQKRNARDQNDWETMVQRLAGSLRQSAKVRQWRKRANTSR